MNTSGFQSLGSLSLNVIVLGTGSAKVSARLCAISLTHAFAPMQGKDLRRLYDFVLEHVPNVMLVATTGQYAEVLFSYVSALKDVVVSKNAQLLTSNSESGRIDIKWADQSVAQVWENSTAAKEELTDQPVLVRRAVAIGRTAIYGQLPILCSLAGEILSQRIQQTLQHLNCPLTGCVQHSLDTDT